MKKILGLLALALIVAACEQPLVSVPAGIDASTGIERGLVSPQSPVALYSESSRSYYIYHGISGAERTYKIVVADLAYTKSVNIRFEMADGTWKDYPAEYVADIRDGEELWQVKTTGTNGWGNTAYLEFGDEYVVNYTVNGKTYWDNNGGQNYREKGAFLKSGLNILRTSADGYKNMVLVRNLAPTKKVTVVYTTDGWATTKTSAAYFSGLVEGTDLETWDWFISDFYAYPESTIEYCFSYDVAGQTFWDNNFGSNYRR